MIETRKSFGMFFAAGADLFQLVAIFGFGGAAISVPLIYTICQLRFPMAPPHSLPAAVIGEALMEQLKKLDQVAYVRFASVYREFKDVSDFVEELQPMLAERKMKRTKRPSEPAT